jgi:hypothetical protein
MKKRYQKFNFKENELTTKERENLPDSAFVFPKDRRYPIPDETHARNALARVAQHGTADEKAKVKAAVKKKYPSIEISESILKEDSMKFKNYDHFLSWWFVQKSKGTKSTDKIDIEIPNRHNNIIIYHSPLDVLESHEE